MELLRFSGFLHHQNLASQGCDDKVMINEILNSNPKSICDGQDDLCESNLREGVEIFLFPIVYLRGNIIIPILGHSVIIYICILNMNHDLIQGSK